MANPLRGDIRIRPLMTLQRRIKVQADKEHRKVSNMTEVLVEEALTIRENRALLHNNPKEQS